MRTLRTPDERFVGLEGFPYTPRYATVDDFEGGELRVHYLDEGRVGSPVVLLLHGEPTWSYLYRTMVSVLVGAGYRCVVPDLVGFGRSDKPVRREDHTYARHVAWMSELVFDRLGLTDINFFGQDWGALIGLRLVTARPHRFARVAISNGGLPVGDRRPTEAFLAWQQFAATSPGFVIGRIVRGGCVRGMTDAVMAAYDAPFPDDSFTAGPRVMPSLVPTSTDDPATLDNADGWETLRRFDRPFLCAFSDSDAITKGGERLFLREVPGCRHRPNVTIEQAGHFVQEDAGAPLASVLADFFRDKQ